MVYLYKLENFGIIWLNLHNYIRVKQNSQSAWKEYIHPVTEGVNFEKVHSYRYCILCSKSIN